MLPWLLFLALAALLNRSASGPEGREEAASRISLFAKALEACDPSGESATPWHLDCVIKQVRCRCKPAVRAPKHFPIALQVGMDVMDGHASQHSNAQLRRVSIGLRRLQQSVAHELWRRITRLRRPGRRPSGRPRALLTRRASRTLLISEGTCCVNFRGDPLKLAHVQRWFVADWSSGSLE